MKAKLGFITVILACIGFTACNKSNLDEGTGNNTIPTVECGEPQVQTLFAGQNIAAGSVTVTNDENNVYVNYTTTGGWWLNKIHLYVGDCELIPSNEAGNPMIGQFPTNITFTPNVTTYTVTVPLSGLEDCYCIAAHAELVLKDENGNIIQTETGWADGEDFGGNSWAMKFTYCTQTCDDNPECDINSGDYRTQTQGGWGSEPNGNNPGMYLATNFETAFPNGITIGCATNSLTFTSSVAIMNFLPQGGTPTVLSTTETNPTTVNNVLAGQILALAISLGFDNAIESYSSSANSLGNLIIGSGPFQGQTVAQFFAVANDVLGGCSSAYSASDINATASAINENFVDGTVNNGFLICNN